MMSVNVNASFGTETSSLALSEGMSVGVPIVASDYGGNPRMVENGVNGLLFPPQNDHVLANVLLRLHDDRALLSRLSEGAHRLYRERFTAPAMVARLEELYTRLMRDKGYHVAPAY
jgi:glycosyltransferase involved in cell wall biosynthesis